MRRSAVGVALIPLLAGCETFATLGEGLADPQVQEGLRETGERLQEGDWIGAGTALVTSVATYAIVMWRRNRQRKLLGEPTLKARLVKQ